MKGECRVKSYTQTQNESDAYTATTTYDIDLKQGWNLVRYASVNLYQDSESKFYPLHKKYETIQSIPEDIGYFFFED